MEALLQVPILTLQNILQRRGVRNPVEVKNAWMRS
jgi:hypothetical protein